MKHTTWTAALILAFAAGATADAQEVVTYQRGTATPRETTWANGFGGPNRALQDVHRFRMRWQPGTGMTGAMTPQDGQPTYLAQGVKANFGQLEVERIRFRSADEALLYAGRLDPAGDGTEVIEVRGNQVVVMRGEEMADPRFAAAARNVAWQELGSVQGTPDLLAVRQGDSATVRSVRRGAYDTAFDQAMEKAREKRTDLGGWPESESSIRQEWDGDDTVTVTGTDFTANLRQGPDGVHGTVGLGEGHSATARYLEDYLAAMENEPRFGVPGPPLDRSTPAQGTPAQGTPAQGTPAAVGGATNQVDRLLGE
jgi:hypothetical protein